SVAGIFAAGDIRKGSVAQLAAVAGGGANAAIAPCRYLGVRGSTGPAGASPSGPTPRHRFWVLLSTPRNQRTASAFRPSGDGVRMIDTGLIDALPVAIYITDTEGRITYYNETAAELWGCRPEIGSARWCGSWRLFRLNGQPLPHDECPMAVALREGRPVRGVEAIAERPDGSRVRVLPFPTPMRDESGRITGAVNLLMDLSERDKTQALSAQLAAIVASSDDAIIS